MRAVHHRYRHCPPPLDGNADAEGRDRKDEARRGERGEGRGWCALETEERRTRRWIKGGQRIGVGEGKTDSAREWRKSQKR